jgi:TM2 domain-containing membrane protein YozV
VDISQRRKKMEKRIDKHVYTWVGTFLFGGIGVDRFMRGQVGLGILKLLTVGLGGVWSLIDWIIALTKLGKYEKDFIFVDKKWSK